MPDHRTVYNEQSDQYDRLISFEDCQGNILPALQDLVPLEGLDVLDLGGGTGRLACMLAPVVRTIGVFDASPHMLGVAAQKLRASGLQNWHVAAADHRHLPVADKVADLIVSGWSICMLFVWYPETWQEELAQAFAEMRRALRPDGTVVILETLGTGYERPYRYENLVLYYDFLDEMCPDSTWIRTDMAFDSEAQAESLLGFFFGEEEAQRMVSQYSTYVPECTGLWWLGRVG